MVDILDAVIARALTPQGRIEAYAAQAGAAVTKANEAVSTAQEAVDSIDAIIQQTQENNEASATAREDAAQALESVNQALEQLEDVDLAEAAQDEIDKLIFELNTVSANSSSVNNLKITYPSGKIETVQNLIKLYSSIGQNTDGTMTQKAISDAIANATWQGGGAAEIDLGSENAGKLVIVSDEGKPIASKIKEEDIIEALIKSGNYEIEGVVGLQIDYENREITRTQEAIGKNIGSDFDGYTIYGGRMRCNVADNGNITAFYGDQNYKDDGSNGQVMIYQPKFYYQRIIVKTDLAKLGSIVKKEILLLSGNEQPGFKLHPLFINESGEPVDYVLLSAYEGSIYDYSENNYDLDNTITIDFDNDKLSSIANAKPITGTTITDAEKLAMNRGTGWHITNMLFESANQMLEMVEFGSLNGQNILGKGISNIQTSGSYNCASITGSTSSLGNSSGAAEATTNEINGNRTVYTDDGRVAISYRGFENPWGNTWRFAGGCKVIGDGTVDSGIPYICNGYNYNDEEEYSNIGFCLPNISGWISAMGYGEKNYDWVYMPVQCSGANDAAPVGDNLWTTRDLNDTNVVAVGGSWSFGTSNGPFYYGCDRSYNYFSNSYNPRLLFIPTKNSIYTANHQKWLARVGGNGV